MQLKRYRWNLLPNKPKNFDEFCERVEKLKLYQWIATFGEEVISFKHLELLHVLPRYELTVDKELQFSCFVYGWSLPSESKLYKSHFRSVRNVTLSSLLQEVMSYTICSGLKNKEGKDVIVHNVPCAIDVSQLADGTPPKYKQFY